MKRPLLIVLLYAVLSLIVGLNANELSNTIITAYILFLTFSTIILITIYKSSNYFYLMIISVIYFCIALNSSKTNVSYVDTLANNGVSVDIFGTVTDKLNRYNDTTLYRIEVNRITLNGAVYNDNFDAVLYFDKKLTIGDNIRLYDKLILPSHKTNPASTDGILSYKIRGLKYKIYADTVNVVGYNNNFNSICNRISGSIVDRIFMIFPYEEACILSAMIVGDNTDLEDDIYELYRSAGIVHIIAISGLHIGIFASLLYFIFGRLHRYVSCILVAAFIVFFCFFTGANISILRATIMLLISTVAVLIGRKYDLITSVSTACCVILLLEPYSIYNIGFQYSFLAVFGIAFTNDLLREYRIQNKLYSGIIVSIITMICIKPITMYHFYTLNYIDFITNIATITLMGIIMYSALFSIALGFICLPIARITALVSVYLLNFIKYISELTVNTPIGTITTGYVPLTVIILIYIALFFLYLAFVKNRCYVTISLISVVLICISLQEPRDYMEISFMDFKNSECTVIKNKDTCFIVDAGENYYSSNVNKLENYLKYIAVDDIDTIFLTELSYSNAGLISKLSQDVTIKKIVIPALIEKDNNYEKILKATKINNISLEVVDNNYNEVFNKDISVRVYTNKNVPSKAIYKIFYKNKSILFPGNFNSEIQEKFIDYDIKADILKVPGRGYSKSLCPDFIESVNPSVAVNFSGNVFGRSQPSDNVTSSYDENRILFYTTNRCGMVNVKIEDDIIYCKTFDEKYREISENLD